MLLLFNQEFTLKLPLSQTEVNQRFSGMVFHGKNSKGQSLFTFVNQEEIDFYTPQFLVTLSPIGKEYCLLVHIGLWRETRELLLKRLVQLCFPEWFLGLLSAKYEHLWFLPLPLLAVILIGWIYNAIRFSIRAIQAKKQFLNLFSGIDGKLLPSADDIFTKEIHLFKKQTKPE